MTARPTPTSSPDTARRLHPSRSGAAPLDGAMLADIAAGLAAVADRSLTAERWTVERRRLLATDAYDAWLIGWGPGALAEPHDHDGSIGALHVVTGELLETSSTLDGRHPAPLRRLRPGDTSQSSVIDVHGLFNPTAATTVTVNVYSPPLGSD